MKLTEKEFIKADGTVIKLTPEWISTKLGEVYELSHLDKIDQERLHYGYMTEALVSFLETTDEKGVPFFERVELKSIDVGNNRISNLLNQKVILDKPSKIERENFYHDFKLWPTIYSDEKKIDDIVVKVHSEFTLCNREGDLELYFNDNLVELNVFELINSYDKKEIYHFTFEDNVASSVIISEMNQPFWTNNKALDNIDVAFEAKNEASIVLESSAINMMVDDRENFTFNPIKVGDYFSLIDSQITFDRESLKNREVELDFDFLYLKDSSISFEGANKEKVGLYTRGATTLDDCEITCVDYSFINKTISTQVIGGEAQKTKIKLENAVINSGVSYYSNVKYDFSTFEIINSKLENEGDEILSLANGISITNSTIKNTLKLANAFIENADVDGLILINNSNKEKAFSVAPAIKVAWSIDPASNCDKNDSRITIKNCSVKLEKEDNQFYLNVYGNVSMSNSNFEGNVDLKTHTLYPYEAIRIRDLNLDDPSKNFVLFDYGNEFNIDINIDNSSFINADFSVSSVSNETIFPNDGEKNPEESSIWDDPDHRRMVNINRSELSGSIELIETSLVEDSVINGGYLYNVSEVKRSYLDRYNVANEKEKAIVDFNSKQAEEPADTKISRDNMDFEVL
jgi:hypothetical protein